MKKQICISLLLMLSSLVSHAQSKIGYAYDAAGNRIRREIVMDATPAKSKKQVFDRQEIYTERLREHAVKIYPNPTQGKMRVAVTGLQSDDKCHMRIYSVQGFQILAFDAVDENTDIDISNQPNGTYLLQITINGLSTTWKIIKK